MFISKRMLLALLISISYSVNADEHASPLCPSLSELNNATQYFYDNSINLIVSDNYYHKELQQLGLKVPVVWSEARILKTEFDSAVCQRLNDLFLSFHSSSELSKAMIYDNENLKYVPLWFYIYYELNDKYLAIRHAYSRGTNNDAQLNLPTQAAVSLFVFDKKNLNFIGDSAF